MIINEIFTSIDGEVSPFHQGTMTTFIRLAGCNLRCPYCDTKYAQEKDIGQEFELVSLYERIVAKGCKKVTITGGEPLLQKEEVRSLIGELLFEGYKVTVETNGSISLPSITSMHPFGKNLGWVIDYKLWCWEKMITTNYITLRQEDWVKFVLQDPEEYRLAKETIYRLRDLGCQAKMALSPVFGKFDPADLILMIKNDQFWDVTVNVQLHKIIWDSKKRGV